MVHELGHSAVCNLFMHGKVRIIETADGYKTICRTTSRFSSFFPLFALGGILAELIFSLILIFIKPVSFMGGISFLFMSSGFFFKNYAFDLNQVNMVWLCSFPFSIVIYSVGVVVLVISYLVSFRSWLEMTENQ